MAMSVLEMKVDREHVAYTLKEALGKLNGDRGEVILDFSSVHRIDANALKVMGDLASAAEDKMAKVTLRCVNIDIYRVLKLLKLAQRFSFLT